MSAKKIRKQVALILREQAELQQSKSQQLRPYMPTESPIAPRRGGFFGGIFESWGLDHEIDIGPTFRKSRLRYRAQDPIGFLEG